MMSEVMRSYSLEIYFSDCLQYTNISNSNSYVLSVKYGIVQGWTLGLLMFLVDINYIVESSIILKFTLYADDTSVCISGYDWNILINTMNREFKLIDKWITASKLTLNSTRSEFMIFHCRQRQFQTEINEVMIDEFILKRVTTMKFLGVHLD